MIDVMEQLGTWYSKQVDIDSRTTERQLGVMAAWQKLGEFLNELQRQSDDELIASLGGTATGQRDPSDEGPPLGGAAAQPRAPVATEQVQDIFDTTAKDLGEEDTTQG